MYNVKSPDPPPPLQQQQPMEPRKPSVPNYQNELIIPNNKIKQNASPAIVTPREKIDGSTKLSLEDVRPTIDDYLRGKFIRLFFV